MRNGERAPHQVSAARDSVSFRRERHVYPFLAAPRVSRPSGLAQPHGPRAEPGEDKPTPPVDPSQGQEERLSFHFQSTMATQMHPSFPAKYSWQNSMTPEAETASAFV